MTMPSASLRRPGQPLLFLAVPLLLSAIVATASYAASGATLGLFFGPILLAPMVVPPLALSVSKAIRRFAVCIIYAGAGGAVWLVAGHLETAVVTRCIIVLLAFALALAFIPPAMARMGL